MPGAWCDDRVVADAWCEDRVVADSWCEDRQGMGKLHTSILSQAVCAIMYNLLCIGT